MGPLAAYSIKSAILLSILLAIYMLTLGRLKAPAVRRYALLSISVATIFIPFLFIYGSHNNSIAKTLDISLSTPTAATSEFTISPICTAIAILISTGIFIAAAISIACILKLLIARKRTVYIQGQKLKVLTDEYATPFCFCGSIYISEKDNCQLPEMILAHENSHISHLHFIDLFIGRIILIAQWWNPIAWLLVKEMQRVHEYQADSDVLAAGYPCKEYQYLLLSRAIGDTRYSFVNGFKHKELKNRLKMINREKSGCKKIIFLMMFIPASSAILAFPISPIISAINSTFSSISLSTLNAASSDSEATPLEGKPQIIVDGIPVPYESIPVNPDEIKEITVRKDNPDYPYGVIEIATKSATDSKQ